MNKLMTMSVPVNKVLRLVTKRRNTTSSESINITDKCVERLKTIANKDDNLRVIVEGGGCAGFQYKFLLDDRVNEDDKVFERDSVRIVVDSISLEFINGSTIDYEEQLIRSAFKITNNPKAAVGCSCGASFSMKIE